MLSQLLSGDPSLDVAINVQVLSLMQATIRIRIRLVSNSLELICVAYWEQETSQTLARTCSAMDHTRQLIKEDEETDRSFGDRDRVCKRAGLNRYSTILVCSGFAYGRIFAAGHFVYLRSSISPDGFIMHLPQMMSKRMTD